MHVTVQFRIFHLPISYLNNLPVFYMGKKLVSHHKKHRVRVSENKVRGEYLDPQEDGENSMTSDFITCTFYIILIW